MKIANSSQITPQLLGDLKSNATGSDTLATLQQTVQSDQAALHGAQAKLTAAQQDPKYLSLLDIFGKILGVDPSTIVGTNLTSQVQQWLKINAPLNKNVNHYFPWIDSSGKEWQGLDSSQEAEAAQQSIISQQNLISDYKNNVNNANTALNTDTAALQSFLSTPAGQNIVNQQAAVQQSQAQVQQAQIAAQSQAAQASSRNTALFIVGGVAIAIVATILLLRHHNA